MSFASWIKEFPGAITICNADGIILEMNDKAVETFEKDGGADLIGKNLFDCHPEPARSKLRDLMSSRKVNCYTIEKKGIRKMIYQSPWYKNGEYGGLVEFSIEIPSEMPHFIRK